MRNSLALSENSGRLWLGTWLLAAIWCSAAMAHHSFTSIYDSDKTVKMTGAVREFLFIHPHPFLVVEIRNEAGARETWRAEMDNRSELEDIGMKANTFRPGDQVTVSGNPRAQPAIHHVPVAARETGRPIALSTDWQHAEPRLAAAVDAQRVRSCTQERDYFFSRATHGSGDAGPTIAIA